MPRTERSVHSACPLLEDVAGWLRRGLPNAALQGPDGADNLGACRCGGACVWSVYWLIAAQGFRTVILSAVLALGSWGLNPAKRANIGEIGLHRPVSQCLSHAGTNQELRLPHVGIHKRCRV